MSAKSTLRQMAAYFEHRALNQLSLSVYRRVAITLWKFSVNEAIFLSDSLPLSIEASVGRHSFEPQVSRPDSR